MSEKSSVRNISSILPRGLGLSKIALFVFWKTIRRQGNRITKAIDRWL
jgi:hypothetical protein